MTIDYAKARYRPRPDLVAAHDDAWARIGTPGAFWTAAERIAIAAETRRAWDCALCAARREALSPYGVAGRHDAGVSLSENVVELVHRLVTDPGRLTRAWFEGLRASGLPLERYVEAVGVATTTIVIDTTHSALGLALPPLPEPVAGEPSGASSPNAGDEGAWVPMAPRPSEEATDTGFPTVPNIGRAMSLVPDAVALFFRAFSPHYRLRGLDFAIDRPEIEYVASRVSALNQCFY